MPLKNDPQIGLKPYCHHLSMTLSTIGKQTSPPIIDTIRSTYNTILTTVVEHIFPNHIFVKN